jgi:ABC-type multidrug transport system fused ATPase/permease subunit
VPAATAKNRTSPLSLPRDGLSRSLLGFVLQATWRYQAVLVGVTLASLPFYYLSLEVAKTLINRVLLAETRNAPVTLELYGLGVYTAPAREMLLELSFAFLFCVLAYQLLKMAVNIYKGLLTERVVAHLRLTLLAMADDPAHPKVPVLHGRLMPMVVMEPEPIGGFCGDILSLPAVQGGLLATALVFIFAQDAWLGLAALVLFPLQAWIFPRLVAHRTRLEMERVEQIRTLSEDIETEIARRLSTPSVTGAAGDALPRLPTAGLKMQIEAIRTNRNAIYVNKFFTYFFLNFAGQLTPFMFYAIGGWFVLDGQVTVGALVAVIAAYRDLTPPWEELLYWWQDSKVVISRYRSLIHQLD